MQQVRGRVEPDAADAYGLRPQPHRRELRHHAARHEHRRRLSQHAGHLALEGLQPVGIAVLVVLDAVLGAPVGDAPQLVSGRELYEVVKHQRARAAQSAAPGWQVVVGRGRGHAARHFEIGRLAVSGKWIGRPQAAPDAPGHPGDHQCRPGDADGPAIDITATETYMASPLLITGAGCTIRSELVKQLQARGLLGISTDVEAITGHAPRRFADFAKEHAAASQ